MGGVNVFEIMLKPAAAIAAAKKEKNLGKTFVMLLVASIVAAVSMLFIMRFSTESVLVAILTLVGAFVGSIVFAFLVKKFMWIMAKKATFFDALTMITFGLFIMSWAYLIGGIIGLIPYIGYWLSGLILLFAFVLANAVMLKAGMDYFECDLLTIIIALAVVYIGVFSAVYFAVFQVAMASFGALTGGVFSGAAGGTAPGLPGGSFPY